MRANHERIWRTEVEPARKNFPQLEPTAAGDTFGAFMFPNGLRVIVGDGEGWEHVSVSREDHCPTWDEMHWVKNLFFKDEEAVMQLHPPASKYINQHPYCLHLWRPTGVSIPLPPQWMV